MAASPSFDDAAAAAAELREKRYRARLRMNDEALWFSVKAPKNRWLALPPEIWAIILALVTMPLDFMMVRSTCKTLRSAAGQRWFGYLEQAYFIPLKHDIRACCIWGGEFVTGHTDARICIWGDFIGFAPTNSSSNRERGFRRKPVRKLFIKGEEAIYGVMAMVEWHGKLALAIYHGDFGSIQVLSKQGAVVFDSVLDYVIRRLVIWAGNLVSVGDGGNVNIFGGDTGSELYRFKFSTPITRGRISSGLCVFHEFLIISNSVKVDFYTNPGCNLVRTLERNDELDTPLVVWGDLLAIPAFGKTRSPTISLHDANAEKVGDVEQGYCMTKQAFVDVWGFLWAINLSFGCAEIYDSGLKLMGRGRLPFACTGRSELVTYVFNNFVVFACGSQLHIYEKTLSPRVFLFPL